MSYDENLAGWATVETGLITDYILVIEEAYFAPDANYNDGANLLLQWHGKGYDENGDPIIFDKEKEPGERREVFGTGKDWESRDGGKTAVHAKGQGGFSSNSIYGMIIDRAINTLGVGPVLAKRGLPTQADVWNGLVFRMAQEEKDWGKNIGKRSRVMPVEYLGLAEDWLASVHGASAPAAAKTAAPAVEEVKAATEEAAPAASAPANILRAKVKAAAKGVDYATFTAKALDIPGVAEDESLLAEIFDESGIFAEVNGVTA